MARKPSSGIFDLRAASEPLVPSDALSLVAQPIIDLEKAAVVGYELLSRFALDPPATPDRVFASAIKVGRGAELEAMVLARALELAASVPPNCFVAVNVDPHHLRAAEVMAVLEGRRLERLVFEMTEHRSFGDVREVRASLDALRARGAIVALDDAGAGYAGLKQILDLKPEIVKLDRDLVKDVHENEARRALVAMLGDLAGQLDAWVLAEGVETAEEALALTRLGVPLAQGYFFARPSPPWAGVDAKAAAFLAQADVRVAAHGATLAALVEPCAVVAAGEPWPEAARVAVRVDTTRRPVTLRVRASGGHVERAASATLRVKPETPIAEAVRRAIARDDAQRWEPLVIIDEHGNLLGVVPLERAVGVLAG